MKTMKFKGQDVKIGKFNFGAGFIYELMIDQYKEANKVEKVNAPILGLMYFAAILKAHNPELDITLEDFIYGDDDKGEITKLINALKAAQDSKDMLDPVKKEGKNA